MKVLITEAQTPLGHALAEELAGQHQLILTHRPGASLAAGLCLDILDPEALRQALHNIEAIVYIPQTLANSPPTSVDEEHAHFDALTRGTYLLYMAAKHASIQKVVHVSSLSVMAHWPREYLVSETWRPRPTTNVTSLGYHLAEMIGREVTRESAFATICLRMATLVKEEEVVGKDFDPDWVDVRDAAAACRAALEWTPRDSRWVRAHVAPRHPHSRWPSVQGSPRFGEIGWEPKHDFHDWWPKERPEPSRCAFAVGEHTPTRCYGHRPATTELKPPLKVAVLGAGGNLGPCIVRELEKHHTLRLADVKPMDTPHESLTMDITSRSDVMRAVEGMDAVINLTVVRQDPRIAFEVNTWGAFNVCTACVEQEVKRLVHTGPVIGPALFPYGYRGDFEIIEEVPSRPGTYVYSLTKCLAEEVCRSFADTYGLSIVGFRLCGIYTDKKWPHRVYFGNAVNEEDLGQAACLAVVANNLPSNFEVFNIMCDSPAGHYPIEKAKRLLGFRPKWNYEEGWKRDRRDM